MTDKPIPDPFLRPVEFSPPEDMKRIIRSLLPPGPAPEVFLVSGRTTEPAAVQGAIVGPPCVKCGSHVWLAPSSQRALADTGGSVAAICLPCLLLFVIGVEKGG